jgi:hypothetical protein
VALFCVALLVGLQGIAPALDVAKTTAPESNWSVTSSKANHHLIVAKRDYDFFPFGRGGGQGQSLPGTKPPPPAPFEVRTSVELLMLVPTREQLPPQFQWPAQVNEHTILESDLGEGLGFRWHGKGSLTFLLDVRRAAKLRGGEDSRALCLRVMALKDADYHTRWGAVGALVSFKESAIPYALKAVASDDRETRYMGIHVLQGLRTPRARAELLKIYIGGDQFDRAGVIDGVEFAPPIPSFKPVYEGSLATGRYIPAVARAALKFGWKDFVPAFQEALAKSKRPEDAIALYEAIDKLGPKTLPRDLLDAVGRVRTGRQKENDLDVLLHSSDKTYLTLFALDCTTHDSKGPSSLQLIGIKLIDSMPPSISAPWIERFHFQDRLSWLRNKG